MFSVLKDDEMVCCICQGEHSEAPNEIVLCEYCLQGTNTGSDSCKVPAAVV